MTVHGLLIRLAWLLVACFVSVNQLHAQGRKDSYGLFGKLAHHQHKLDKPVTEPFPMPPEMQHVRFMEQTDDEAFAKSWGCVECHQGTTDMHASETVKLGCTDCHGGHANATTKHAAHVHSRFPHVWTDSGNPVRTYALLNHESPEFIRFFNPGDLRVAHISCGTTGCHTKEVLQVRKSMMTHGCMLWGSAAYNNGVLPLKRPIIGESYSMHGKPLVLQTVPPPTPEEIERENIVPYLVPFPRFEISQPANVFRIFERGGRFIPEVGIPQILEEPGRPRTRVSNRGFGTLNRTDPVLIGAQKTRLFDPTLNFLGTNDHPGDYRSSGCTGCHVIYANDSSPMHSGPYAKYGNRGFSFSADPMIPKNEPGHPIEHRFTKSIPNSQCIVCHVHPGTNVINSYLGYMWWDLETDGELMYPHEQPEPTAEGLTQTQLSDPNEAAARGLWSNPEFLANLRDLNPQLRHTQFADFAGHGWVFSAIFKKDRSGNLLDYRGDVIPQVQNGQLMYAVEPPNTTELQYGKRREGTPVHYVDIHLERGMHCVDCHFLQDNHGNSKLYGEVRAAIEITCIDCHGSVTETALQRAETPGVGNLRLATSGPAAPKNRSTGERIGTNLFAMKTPWNKPRFEQVGEKLIQRSAVHRELEWEIVQTKHTIQPESGHYNEKSALAKTVRMENDGTMVWGDIPEDGETRCAHADNNMNCIACHSSWNQSCFGCHLPQKANKKAPNLHNEGDVSRNYVSYNFQTLRDDVYMLARDGDVTGNKIGPARSSCAIHVGSFNQNREAIYVQQQTVSGGGLSGIAFSSNVPHTVRGGPPRYDDLRDPKVHRHLPSETKMCTDCHLSEKNDNNAIMAQLLMQGTNFVNFIGRYCWVATGEHGMAAAIVTETNEPQAVIGSTLHQLAFPEEYKKHLQHRGELEHAHEHPGIDIARQLLRPFAPKPDIHMLQLRGEFVYAACGPAGLRVFDVAFIDHKGFSERIVTAPVSPLGQRFYVPTKCCTSVAAPTTVLTDAKRMQFAENNETPIHPLYNYLYVTDSVEGLILVEASSLLDGIPTNNFLRRALTFNPNGILCGAHSVTIAGTFAYVCCDHGVVVISIENPLNPFITKVLGEPEIKHPKSVAIQFRYALIGDEEGVKVYDVTDLANPEHVIGLELEDVHNLYVARGYAYVAAGHHGLVILNVENPADPRVDQIYDAHGEINDLHDVKLGITYSSEFAYLADGKNGLRVVQLTSPETKGASGYNPRPEPKLIATFKIPKEGHALYISEGIDRDRAVDESGNQISVFGRIGARPLTFEEQRKMYMLPNGRGVWKVSNDPSDPRYQPTRSNFLRSVPSVSRLPDVGKARKPNR